MHGICIDIGNTSASIGRWEDGAVTRITAVDGGARDIPACEAALGKAGAGDAADALMASVVPSANAAWEWLLRRVYGLDLQILTHQAPMPLGIDYPDPAQIGADRLADAAGALTRHGAPVIVADFGTALTFDAVDAAGAYSGGVIAPGIPLMGSYLHEKTARLPPVDLRGAFPAWGDSTQNAMKLGARVGYCGMVREIASFIRGRVGAGAPLVATGGYARWALEGSGIECRIEPDLTLFGLGVILDYGRGRRMKTGGA